MVTKKRNKFGRSGVRFREGCKIDTDNGVDTIIPEWGNKEVVCSHTKRYHNCLYLLAGLGGCARDLMDFITEEMDDENVVTTNEHFRLNFSRFIKLTTNGDVEYSDSSIKRSLTVLTKKGLIRHVKRGYSIVNPEYFWKNDDKKRGEKIKIELEFLSGYDTKLKVLQEKINI